MTLSVSINKIPQDYSSHENTKLKFYTSGDYKNN